MMERTRMTLEEFIHWALRPENSSGHYEFINGEVIEVSPGRTSNSGIGHRIVVPVHNYGREHSIPCHTSGGDGAYDILGHVVAPDFAYKPTPMSKEYPDPVPPLWAVEIISPTDKPYEIRAKREIYRQAEILYWEMYPEAQSVDVYPPGEPMRTVGMDEMLDGGKVLPGFTLPVRELFSE